MEIKNKLLYCKLYLEIVIYWKMLENDDDSSCIQGQVE